MAHSSPERNSQPTIGHKAFLTDPVNLLGDEDKRPEGEAERLTDRDAARVMALGAAAVSSLSNSEITEMKRFTNAGRCRGSR